jgi:hypothetical protein
LSAVANCHTSKYSRAATKFWESFHFLSSQLLIAILGMATAAVSHPGFFATSQSAAAGRTFRFRETKQPKRELRVVPLTRAQDNYISGPDSLRFLMRDGPREVLCRISRETLSDLRAGEEGADVFEVCRGEIEQAASNKYDRTSRRDYEIVTVTGHDLALAKALQSLLSDNKVHEGRDSGLLRMLNAPPKRKRIAKPAPKKK